MLTSVFILVLNNGESYEDFSHWNEGIYPSLESAYAEAFKSSYSRYGFNVEEWNVKGSVRTYEYDVKGKLLN